MKLSFYSCLSALLFSFNAFVINMPVASAQVVEPSFCITVFILYISPFSNLFDWIFDILAILDIHFEFLLLYYRSIDYLEHKQVEVF